MLACVLPHEERRKISVEMLSHLNIRRFPHRATDQPDLHLRLNSFCVLRSLVKVYRWKRSSQIRSRMLLIPQLKTLVGFKMVGPLNIFDWCSAVMRAPAQRLKVSAKGWGALTSLWLHRSAHFQRHSPVPSGPKHCLQNVDIWEVNMGGKKTKELTMCVNHGFPALSIETFPETSGDR